jgi:hypothetical protein
VEPYITLPLNNSRAETLPEQNCITIEAYSKQVLDKATRVALVNSVPTDCFMDLSKLWKQWPS